MAVLTNSGRAAIATAVKNQTIHMAWGSGNPDWDDTPYPSQVGSTALVAEIGRRRASQLLYCTPDPAGELVVPDGRFTASLTPTKYLYMRFTFDFADAPAAAIREVAVFLGTTAKPAVPPGQDYLEPDDILDPGQMLSVENIPKMQRSPLVRQQFEFVIQF